MVTYDDIVKYATRNMSLKEIAKITGVCMRTLQRVCEANGSSFKTLKPPKKLFIKNPKLNTKSKVTPPVNPSLPAIITQPGGIKEINANSLEKYVLELANTTALDKGIADLMFKILREKKELIPHTDIMSGLDSDQINVLMESYSNEEQVVEVEIEN